MLEHGLAAYACCDIWGQCGTTSEFCTISQSPTGAPGTAAVGTNGCISNCGTDIVESGPPSEFMKVAYFEAYDSSRPCLSSSVSSIADSGYTHVHLAFAAITPDFQVNITGISDQFNSFISLTGFKQILSFSRWAFSTDPSTYDIFRQAVTSANCSTLISNIVAFVQQYGLDRVDFDWEYPGEPDIPGIPLGSPNDGLNYFLFLNDLQISLQAKVPGTTVSIAAPASYWYFQYFPISAITLVMDYIIFMTYDLHGQWDYGNAFSDPSYPLGNCLHSDVNLTETINALSMITKAGVPSNMVVVGVTSYGCLFQMTTAGCYTELCTFTGPSSGAYPGPCTDTAGYLANAEINYINATLGSTISYIDLNSYSNILVYDDMQWVGYMDDNIKAVQTNLYEGLNFSGTTN
ncbi:hypothetical protein VTN77DRAFT_7381 [Rasamsonia byssochlamydoides]|uniref:uncharacterized protein n=1 Tax=Rasamsonia byssochlamydoides TaxID=89139 RepID=UPI0037422E70